MLNVYRLKLIKGCLPTSHDDVKDTGVALGPDHVGGGAHDGAEVHGGERRVAQHAARAVVLGPAL